MKKIKIFWERWKKFGRKVADFQGRTLLTIAYFLIFLPVGILIRFFSDPLKLKGHTSWNEWKTKVDNLEESRNQF